jgi:hydroxylamine reductase
MYCVQCEQSNKGGCAKVGLRQERASGRHAGHPAARDAGRFAYARAAAVGARDARVDAFTPHAWFTTLTNVNFDAARLPA